MRCLSCSSPVPDGSRFCGACGSSLDPADAPTRVTVKPASPGTASPASLGAGGLSSSDPVTGSRFIPGTVLAGRYRIVGLLGRGGMGEVCRADDMMLGQPVALKFLPEALERDPERLRRFLNEVKIARQISHPNVCRVYDVGEVDGQHFISMEFVDGEDLASLLRRIGHLPSDKALQIARQLCAGVGAAHEKGILHRDLKPANVMIDGRGQVRITDFGLAGMTGEIDATEASKGTPDYMAPEQFDGKVTERSDIYSLGHVLYEMFTGKRAFRADTLAELSRLQRESTPTSPSTLIDGLDPAVERAILRCLEKDPRERPASALRVSAALPGGDPIAAALAAGETPSPEMVAAAGPEGGLRPAVAFACLGSVIVGLFVVSLLLGKAALYRFVPMDKPIAALADRAREITRSFGYTEPPVDSFCRFRGHKPALQYFAEQDSSPSRWEPLREPGEIGIYMMYRQGERHLVPRNIAGRVEPDDPSPQAGDVYLTIGLQGRLLRFAATPQFVEHSTDPAPEIDWSVVFDAAGLDMEKFEPIPPTIQPAAFGDVRAAWKGVLPHRSDLPVRVEAAALRGRPVFFETVTPYDDYWSAETEEARQPVASIGAGETAALVMLVLVAGGAMFLAVHNWRLARGDRKGALRLAIYVLALRLLHWLIVGHHVASLGREFGMFIGVLGGALVLAVSSWVLYMALEPYFRRLWPELLVSWTRLLTGRFRDPLVGRDVLIGLTFGIAVQLLSHLPVVASGWLGLAAPPPTMYAIDALAGGRQTLGALFPVLLVSLALPLSWILLFLLLRMVLRRQLPAVIVFCLIIPAFEAFENVPIGGEAFSWGQIVLGVVASALTAIVLITLILRFGVLATAACFLMANLLAAYPITFDSSAPYFTTSLFALLFAVALTTYAFYTSLAGQLVFHDAILQEQT